MTFVFRQGTASAVPRKRNRLYPLRVFPSFCSTRLAVFAPVLVAVASEAGPFSLPRAFAWPFSSPL
jgi:hypothetical protein